jgi:hypothetical protein
MITEQQQWLADHPEWTAITAEKHHRDYIRAANGRGPWYEEYVLDGDGTTLPNDAMLYPWRIYVRRVAQP